jgi:predicted DNA-binding transcriptional regulator YafY
MGEYSGKLRMLKVLQILERETDAEHALTLKEINEKLKREFLTDETAGKKALDSDIRAIKDAGYWIETKQRGKNGPNEHWLDERLFEPYQLRMLIDAVMFSTFITKKDAWDLINKLLTHVSVHQAKKLREQCRDVDYIMRTEDHKLKYYIDHIYEAIEERKEIRFKYGKYNRNKEFQYHKNGEWYVARPYALVWWENKYYLVAEYEDEPDFRHFRVDRMRMVEKLEVGFDKKNLNLGEYVRKSFHMFNGEEKLVKLQFEDNEKHDFLNVVYDRFGLGVDVESADGQSFVVKAKVKVSQGLVNWILTWGSRVKVLEPKELVDQVKSEAKKLYRKYHGDPVQTV